MRLVTGKKIGQSGQELLLAIVFSCVIHLIILFTTIFLYRHVTMKYAVPPAYQVALVDQPSDVPLAVPPSPQPLPPPPKVKAPQKKAAPKSVPEAIPELDARKRRGDELREELPEEPGAQPAPQGGVAVSAGQDFRFPPYLAIIRDKIVRNWNPPPGAVEMKARVQFTIHRSGRVLDAKLEAGSGNFYFDQAAMRAVLASSPFPPLPEGVFSMSEVFSVDLLPKE
jgi:protein TonB